MIETIEKPSLGFALASAPMPFAAVVIALPLVGLISGQPFADVIVHGGAGAYPPIGAAGLLGVIAGIWSVMVARVIRFSPALLFPLLLAPWGLGVFGFFNGMAGATEAVANVNPVDKAIIMAAAMSEASQCWLLGSFLTAALFLGLIISFAMGALARRSAADRGLRAGLVGASLVAAALGLWAAANAIGVGYLSRAYRAAADLNPLDQQSGVNEALAGVAQQERVLPILLLAVAACTVLAAALIFRSGGALAAAALTLAVVLTVTGALGAERLAVKTQVATDLLFSRLKPTDGPRLIPFLGDRPHRWSARLEHDGLVVDGATIPFGSAGLEEKLTQLHLERGEVLGLGVGKTATGQGLFLLFAEAYARGYRNVALVGQMNPLPAGARPASTGALVSMLDSRLAELNVSIVQDPSECPPPCGAAELTSNGILLRDAAGRTSTLDLWWSPSQEASANALLRVGPTEPPRLVQALSTVWGAQHAPVLLLPAPGP